MGDPQGEKRYKIGEAAQALGLEPYVLRYWESEFPQLVPERTARGQRKYTPEDLVLLRRIKELLYQERVTIEGARIRLAEEEKWSGVFREVRQGLLQIKELLDQGSEAD